MHNRSISLIEKTFSGSSVAIENSAFGAPAESKFAKIRRSLQYASFNQWNTSDTETFAASDSDSPRSRFSLS